MNTLTYSTTNCKWYVNGVPSNTSISGGGSASAITKFNISPAGNFAGRLKHLRLFNRALTADEVMALFAEAI